MLDIDDIEDLEEILEEYEERGIIRADCVHGCEVEIDGKCPHGKASVLGAL